VQSLGFIPDISGANLQILMERQIIKNALTSLKPSFQGSTHLVCTDPTIKDENSLTGRLLDYCYRGGLVRSNQTPASYWQRIIEEIILEEKLTQIKTIIKKMAYREGQPVGQDTKFPLLYAFTTALTGQPASDIDVHALAHFIWQIKRKILGLTVEHHLMPIVWGKGGAGKSRALELLISPIKGYVIKGLSFDKLGDDRYFKQLADHLLVFFDEMPKVEKASVESIKQIISESTLTGRVLYSNGHKSYPQNCTFLGTSNLSPAQLIHDPTGMRRFHYIKCADKVDRDVVNNINYCELWGEVNEYRDYAYTTEVMDKLTEVQEELRIKDSVEMFISEGFIIDNGSNEVRFRAREAYEVYKDYCKEAGISHSLAKQSFNRLLSERYKFRRVNVGGIAELRTPQFYGQLNKNPSKLDGKGL
jgi:hypothetical protein